MAYDVTPSSFFWCSLSAPFSGRRPLGRRLGELLDDLVREQMAVVGRAPGDEIPVDHHVLVVVDRTHVPRVAVEVVVAHHTPPAYQLGCRGDEPQAVADDALEDARLAERALQQRG